MPPRKEDQPNRREDSVAYMREYRAKNPERTRELWEKANSERVEYRRAYHAARKDDPIYQRNRRSCRLKAKYGITIEEFENLVSNQNGCCRICKEYTGDKLCVDHSHETKEVRGLLCDRCNVGLGNFRDHVEFLQSAIIYLSGS